MQLQQIANHLQITKVVWIDDLFSKNKENLKTLLISNLALIADIDEPFFKSLVVTEEFNNANEFPESFKNYLITVLDNIDDQQVKIIFGNITQALSDKDPEHKDMNGATIDFLTTSLNAIDVCRKSFTEAFDDFDAIFSQDEGTLYLIDKDNKYDAHPEFSNGIEVIKKIVNSNSKGMPVLFSHNFQPHEESAHEIDLFKEINPNSSNCLIPLTVVSKNQFDDQATREERLMSALKRITVRYTIGKMASSLKEEVDKGFANAISKLNGVPTAQLDKYLIKSATEEGISEAHVLERIISAEMKTSIKNRLADDDSQQKLQMLRKIKLDPMAGEATPELLSFFESEVYESENLLNKTFSPIACGDIFEEINVSTAEKQRFILIAPPCDTALRGGNGSNLGKRNGSVAFIAAIKPVNESESSSLKKYCVPVKFLDKNWAIDFNCLASVNLSILDWCSFNKSGLVSHKADIESNLYMLPGVEKRHQDSAKNIEMYFNQYINAKDKVKTEQNLLIDLSRNQTWSTEFSFIHTKDSNCPKLKRISNPKFLDSTKEITFPLKRVGRLKSPYSETILRRLSETLSRSVFELHYMK